MMTRSIQILYCLLAFSFSTWGQSNLGLRSRILELDSLIHAAAAFGLQQVNYTHSGLDSMLLGQKSMDASAVDTMAQQFFKDLRDGRQVPHFRFEELKISRPNVILSGNFKELANRLIDEVPEVKKLLGVLRDSTDLPVAQRAIVVKAIQEYRWLSALRRNHSVVLINIPSATLHAFDGQKEQMKMKVVVGKASRPSKTLVSSMREFIITPYWNVPRSIAVEELVPEIRKNIRYFYASHLEIFDFHGRKVAPEQVPWSRLHANYFPYSMRQRSGKWNTLGILKFPFNNPFRMYIHDSSEKKLFQRENRFYSHSCIRVERPIDLGRFLLKPHSKALDTLDQAAAYSDRIPRYIKVKRTIPLVIWYSLLDFDAQGKIQFYPNIYRKN
jgi:hypothetical protein